MESDPKGKPKANRISRPTRTQGDREIVDYDTYIPYFLAVVNNAMSRSASALYLTRFGIGIGEWRVLSIIANEPGVAASHIGDVVAMDKAAVSRSLGKLETLEVLEITVSPSDPRRRAFSLTKAGYALHDQILAIALEREGKLIQGTDPEDLEAFLRVMRTMRHNLRNI